jgi:hypothetical protein
MYKEDKNRESAEGIKNPEVSKYLQLVKEYNDACNQSLRSYSFDGDYNTVTAFPGQKIELPEGGLEEKSVPEYLKQAEEKFFDFNLSLYTRMPIGKKGTYDLQTVNAKDFLKLPEELKPAELKKILETKLKELSVESEKERGFDDHSDINEGHSAAKEAALVSALMTRLGENEKAAQALEISKKLAGSINDYSSQSGLKYLAIALAEVAKGDDPTKTLVRAQNDYMHYIGGFDTRSGISPMTRYDGLTSIAKIKVLAGQDPLPALSEIRSIEDRISDLTKLAIGGFEQWAKIRSMIKDLEEKKEKKTETKK